MRLLFLMDPMETVLTQKDTTFAMMLAAAARGHECVHALPLDLECDLGKVSVKAATVHVSRKPGKGGDGLFEDAWTIDAPTKQKLSSFDAVLIRKDPPFDANYAYMTQ